MPNFLVLFIINKKQSENFAFFIFNNLLELKTVSYVSDGLAEFR